MGINDFMSLKYLSLVVLTFQTTAQILLVRYTRNVPKGYPLYETSTVVVFNELFKLFASFLLISYEKGFEGMIQEVLTEVVYKPYNTLLLIIPSGLFTLQTNLIYVSLSHVDATTFQVTYQLKILTTAIFFVLLLNKKITNGQWLSLVLLTAGIILVQKMDSSSSSSKPGQNYLYGLFCLIVSAISSGFAGVYFEKLLKTSNVGIWTRNIQLSLFGIVFSLINVYINGYNNISNNGFLYGYNLTVWLCVILQAFGGLVVACVIKYADNILKVFSSGIAIVLTYIIGLFGEEELSLKTIIGIAMVCYATYLYNTASDHQPVLEKDRTNNDSELEKAFLGQKISDGE